MASVICFNLDKSKILSLYMVKNQNKSKYFYLADQKINPFAVTFKDFISICFKCSPFTLYYAILSFDPFPNDKF